MIKNFKLKKRGSAWSMVEPYNSFEKEKKELYSQLPDSEENTGKAPQDISGIISIFEGIGKVEIKDVQIHERASHISYEVYPKKVDWELKKKSSCQSALCMHFGIGVGLSVFEEGKKCFVVRVPYKQDNIGTVTIKSALSKLYELGNPVLPIILGEGQDGAIEVNSLEELPHLLIAGSTGSGKSSVVHSNLVSMLLTNTPDKLQFVMIDVKRVEFSMYEELTDYLATPIVTDPSHAVITLEKLCKEMDKRFELLEHYGLKNISDIEGWQGIHTYNHIGHIKMPRIVVVIDEFADLVATDKEGIRTSVGRLAQKGRAAGIHLIVATQRPSTEVLPGDVKVNFEHRLCFKVATAVDSRVVLGKSGAENIQVRGECMTQDGKRYLAPYTSIEQCRRIIKAISGMKDKDTYSLPKSNDDYVIASPKDPIDRCEMTSGNIFWGLHGLKGDFNKDYEYIYGGSTIKNLRKITKDAMERGYVDERIIVKLIGCSMMDAIEYKNKLRYLRVVHTNKGFCQPSPVNDWKYGKEECIGKTDALVLREEYSDEFTKVF